MEIMWTFTGCERHRREALLGGSGGMLPRENLEKRILINSILGDFSLQQHSDQGHSQGSNLLVLNTYQYFFVGYIVDRFTNLNSMVEYFVANTGKFVTRNVLLVIQRVMDYYCPRFRQAKTQNVSCLEISNFFSKLQARSMVVVVMDYCTRPVFVNRPQVMMLITKYIHRTAENVLF